MEQESPLSSAGEVSGGITSHAINDFGMTEQDLIGYLKTRYWTGCELRLGLVFTLV